MMYVGWGGSGACWRVLAGWRRRNLERERDHFLGSARLNGWELAGLQFHLEITSTRSDADITHFEKRLHLEYIRQHSAG